jgi:gliding motility-associated-like protein
MLYAYNQLGCEDSVEHPLLVLPPEAFFIPNAFTPNGDGNNDLFFVQTQAGANVLMFQVFDRWGEMVHDELFPWDGTYHGKPCPPGVYVYLCKIGLVSQNIGLIKKGSVTLIR